VLIFYIILCMNYFYCHMNSLMRQRNLWFVS